MPATGMPSMKKPGQAYLNFTHIFGKVLISLYVRREFPTLKFEGKTQYVVYNET